MIQYKKEMIKYIQSFLQLSEFMLLDSLCCMIMGMITGYTYSPLHRKPHDKPMSAPILFLCKAEWIWSLDKKSSETGSKASICAAMDEMLIPEEMTIHKVPRECITIAEQWPVGKADLEVTASIYLTYLRGVLPLSAIIGKEILAFPK